jgi:hypothetical protein
MSLTFYDLNHNFSSHSQVLFLLTPEASTRAKSSFPGLTMDFTTAVTTFGGLTTSVFSSFAAVLAWKTKLQYADEFKEAKEAQVKTAEQMVESANIRREAQIEIIKTEIAKKDIEIEKLRVEIERLERETPKALLVRFEDMRNAYESMMADLPGFNTSSKSEAEQNALENKKGVFEAQLTALGDELGLMAQASQEASNCRKAAKDWLDDNAEKLAQGMYKYTQAKYPKLKYLCESESPEFGVKNFYWDILMYLEVISACLVTNRTNLINQNLPTLSISEPYRIAALPV